MTAPPVNSDEDYYMDEPFDEESQSEVEEEDVEEEQEDEVLEESDSQSDSDAEAEFRRGNVSSTNTQPQLQELPITQFSLNLNYLPSPQPHARRHQIYGNRSGGGGSGFARETATSYPSSSDDESQVIVSKTVAEVNPMRKNSSLTDDETLSVHTLIPNSCSQMDNEYPSEIEDDKIDEMGEDEEIVETDGEDLLSEHSNEEKIHQDATIAHLSDDDDEEEEEDEDDEVQIVQESNKHTMVEHKTKNQDLVEIVDVSDYSDGEEVDSQQGSDNEMEFMTMPLQPSMNRLPQGYTKLMRNPMYPANIKKQVDVGMPTIAKLQENEIDNESVNESRNYDNDDESENDNDVEIVNEIEIPNCDEGDASDMINVKFLEQKMTEMSEMIMKTFRLSGGASNSSALEQLATATNLMKKQSKHLEGLEEEPESIETLDSPTTMRSDNLNRKNCRCPINEEVTEPDDSEASYMMDECGQGDGLMRYPHLHQSQAHRISGRVSSFSPSSLNSERSGKYPIDVSRPRSCTSSEKINYKNLGRKSFSFTNPQVREIERQNQILLKKMMHVKPTIKTVASSTSTSSNQQAKKQPPPAPRLSSAAINRKKYQRQIDLDNDVLKRKLEAVGSRRPLFK